MAYWILTVSQRDEFNAAQLLSVRSMWDMIVRFSFDDSAA